MGDEGGGAAAPLLSHTREDELWDAAEQAPPPIKAGPSMAELMNDRPQDLIKELQRSGVQMLGEFEVEDRLVLGKLGDDSIMTMGADRPDIDFEEAWRKELGEPLSSSTGWSNKIPVVAYVVHLRNAAAPDKDGLLQPLLKRWQVGGCGFSVFALPAVQAVIDWKWHRFCKRLLLWELAFFLLWLAAFSAFTIAFQDEDMRMSLPELLATTRGKVTLVADLVALVCMTPFLIIEVCTMVSYGWGWATAWNLLDTLTYIFQIAIVVMHVGRLNISSNWLSIAAALQCVLLLFRLQYFSRVFKATRFSFLDSLKEVVHDVKWYLAFLLLIMWGFAAAFHILYRRDQEKHEEFSNIGKSFVTMVTWVAGNADLQPLYSDAHNPITACALGCAYVFVLGMVLASLLTGIMTNSLDKVTQNEGLRMLLSKAQAIDELETTIPRSVERLFPWLYPKYLHVLRVDPEKLDSVRLDNLWSKKGDDEEAGALLGEPRRRPSPANSRPTLSQRGGLLHWQGSLVAAYLDALDAAAQGMGWPGAPPEWDNSMRLLQGDAQSPADSAGGGGEEGGDSSSKAGSAGVEARLDALQRDVQELKQLLLRRAEQ